MNPTLHEGLLLLIYEYFKTQTLSKTPLHGVVSSKDSDSSSFSFDIEVIQRIISEGEEKISSGKKVKKLEKKFPSPITPIIAGRTSSKFQHINLELVLHIRVFQFFNLYTLSFIPLL